MGHIKYKAIEGQGKTQVYDNSGFNLSVDRDRDKGQERDEKKTNYFPFFQIPNLFCLKGEILDNARQDMPLAVTSELKMTPWAWYIVPFSFVTRNT